MNENALKGLLVFVLFATAACGRHTPPRPTNPPEPTCPEGMATIRNRFCIDRWEASLVEITGQGERPYSPYDAPDKRVVRAVTGAGMVPQGYISRDQAEAACRGSHKRLCNEDEWVLACKGDPPRTFPYGDVRNRGACNDIGISPLRILYREPEMYQPKPMNDPRLNQQPNTLARAGEFSRCTNGFGVFDMVGNLHEWVMSQRPTFRGGYYQDTHINGDGCAYRTTAHMANYHDYSTGFRCCADMNR